MQGSNHRLRSVGKAAKSRESSVAQVSDHAYKHVERMQRQAQVGAVDSKRTRHKLRPASVENQLRIPSFLDEDKQRLKRTLDDGGVLQAGSQLFQQPVDGGRCDNLAGCVKANTLHSAHAPAPASCDRCFVATCMTAAAVAPLPSARTLLV